tara:strand:- start:323 stop:430 length:108 start_codon:yes stop_codon:yes gene_type:complete
MAGFAINILNKLIAEVKNKDKLLLGFDNFSIRGLG